MIVVNDAVVDPVDIFATESIDNLSNQQFVSRFVTDPRCSGMSVSVCR